MLGSTLILFINHETLNEYVVEGDDKLEIDLDNAPDYMLAINMNSYILWNKSTLKYNCKLLTGGQNTSFQHWLPVLNHASALK